METRQKDDRMRKRVASKYGTKQRCLTKHTQECEYLSREEKENTMTMCENAVNIQKISCIESRGCSSITCPFTK